MEHLKPCVLEETRRSEPEGFVKHTLYLTGKSNASASQRGRSTGIVRRSMEDKWATITLPGKVSVEHGHRPERNNYGTQIWNWETFWVAAEVDK